MRVLEVRSFAVVCSLGWEAAHPSAGRLTAVREREETCLLVAMLWYDRWFPDSYSQFMRGASV